MKTYIKYYFHIIDVEFDSEYDFEAYFESHFEADRFIQENERVGNTVIILAPYFEEVQMRPEDLPRIQANLFLKFVLDKRKKMQ